MADRIEPFTVTIPPGVAIATPQTFSLSFDDGVVTRIIVTIPPGPSGFMGFQFRHKGGPVIPYTGGQFIVGDDRVVDWPVANMPTADGWELYAYNTDIYQHSVYIEFLIDEIPVGPTPRVAILDI